MKRKRGSALRRSLALTGVGMAGALAVSCAGSSPSSGPGVLGRSETRAEAYERLRGQLDEFRISGMVRTTEGLLLPETITIEIRSEICVESREPGARFWSLDYDTCFAFAALDTVDEAGKYSLSVPCIDPEKTYESRHAFGDLRLVQRGPVSFLAVSDAGWRHQQTFTSARTGGRNLELALEPEPFYVVREGAPLRVRPHAESTELRRYGFGTEVPVIRFHNGWAECLMGERIGWMEMRYLGTEEEMREKAPFKAKPRARPRRIAP